MVEGWGFGSALGRLVFRPSNDVQAYPLSPAWSDSFSPHFVLSLTPEKPVARAIMSGL